MLKITIGRMCQVSRIGDVIVAQAQGALWWELRATVGLSRLLHEQGRTDEARALLNGVYAKFSEGLSTPDLQEAAALLAQL